MRLKIAVRNTFRNKRRTLLNGLMIAGGVAAIIVFRGFCSHMLYDLREITVRSNTAHFQVATPTYWEKAAKTPKDGLLPSHAELLENIKKQPHVKAAAGRITFFGLLTANENAFSARGISIDPESEKEKLDTLKMVAGSNDVSTNKFQALLGFGLAQKLRVKVGDSFTLLSYTYEGSINALDIIVGGTFQTALSEFDDTTFLLPLKGVQTLLDTEQVEQVLIYLDETDNTSIVKPELQKLMTPEIQLKEWLDLSAYYHQVYAFFGTQNTVLEFIIVALVLLGVINTLGMSVFERFGEIGTVRALGETESGVVQQFLLEGVVLGIIGATAGVLLGTGLSYLVGAFNIKLTIPGASVPVRIQIDLFLASYSEAVLVAFIASVFGAFFPALRASRVSIVEALRHSL